MIVRNNSLVAGDDRPDTWANGYRVIVYPVGAVASGTYTGLSPAVFRGHSFRDGDYALIVRGSTTLQAGVVDGTPTATQITFAGSVSVIYGDKLVNIGADSAYAYTQSPMRIFSVPGDDTSAIANASITASQRGRYTYGYRGNGSCWELILDASNAPIDVLAGFECSDGRLNPVDFGATGDNSTDDSARFNALSTALSDGDEVLVPAGTYRIGTNWDIENGDVTVHFQAGAKIRVHDSVTTGMKMVNVIGGASRLSNIKLYDVVLEDLDAAAHSNGEQTHGIVAEQVDNLIIRGATITGMGDEAINLIDCNYFTVTECYLAECGKIQSAGNITLSLCQHGRVSRCTSKSSQSGAGIRIEAGAGGAPIVNTKSAYITLDGNAIVSPINSGPGGGQGIQLNAGSNDIEHIVIANNTITAPVSHGIFLFTDAGQRIDHCVVANNCIEGGGGSVPGDPAHEGAIDLDSRVRYTSVVGNVVEGWGDATTFTHGIRIKRGGGAVTGNVLRNLNNNSGVAIYCDTSSGVGDIIKGNIAIGGITAAANDVKGTDDVDNIITEAAEV